MILAGNNQFTFLAFMKKITQQVLTEVSEKAKQSPRLRMNLNYHEDLNDSLQRLLNAMEPGTYIRPHKHENPDKREMFFILQGKAAVIEFDAHGNITDHCILSINEGNYGIEIAPKIFHTVIALEKNTVVIEIKDGPYAPINDKAFASWSPAENTAEVAPFLLQLLQKIKYHSY